MVPVLPFIRISRVEEMFSASRNRVSSSSVVGKTLNSTGLRMYIATIITTTDIMMSVTMRMSSTKPRQRRDQRDHDAQHGDRNAQFFPVNRR